MCVLCAPCAPSWHVGACWCRVCSCSQHLQQTQHAKCVGGMAKTRAHACRETQLCSPSNSSSSNIGDNMCVASVVSLATTRARTHSMQQQQQQQQSAQQEGSTCVGTASNQGTTSAHAPPTLLMRELHVQGKGGVLRGYMYRTKHINGICRITLFSNVSLASKSWSGPPRKNRGRPLGLGFETW